MTPAKFREKVLRVLEVTAAGETPAGDDDTTVSEHYTAWHAEHAARRKFWWNVDDNIPDEVALPLAQMMANDLKGEFHVPSDRIASLEVENIRAKMRFNGVVSSQDAETTETSAEFY